MGLSTLTAPASTGPSFTDPQDISKRRILFLVTEDWYFTSHRLRFAEELVRAQYEVAVGCRFSGAEETIRERGVTAFSLPFGRESLSIHRALKDAKAIRKLMADYKPDLVHLVALRPILLGWLATLGNSRPPFVNAIAGLGSMFTGRLDSLRLRLAQRVILMLMRAVFRHSSTYNVFQNQEDLESFVQRGYSNRDHAFLIRGAGVDPTTWTPIVEPSPAEPVILFVGRLLREKGLVELLQASQILRGIGKPHRIWIAGAPDPCNPKSLSDSEIKEWQKEGKIEWLGKRSDVLELMSSANLVALPSYREGLPKVLLEAGLACRAVVTCDVVGCREIVSHMKNGLLVPPRDASSLAKAIATLLDDPPLRTRLAERHHDIVRRDFSLGQVTHQFLRLYQLAFTDAGQVARNHRQRV